MEDETGKALRRVLGQGGLKAVKGLKTVNDCASQYQGHPEG